MPRTNQITCNPERRIVESSEVEVRKLLTTHDANSIKEAIHLMTLWKQVSTVPLTHLLPDTVDL